MTDATPVRISVCIATHNGANHVEEQLVSIVRQLGPIDEIILVDDASADGTMDVVDRVLSHSGIAFTVIRNTVADGPMRSFEKAIDASVGQFVFLSDQDDVWHADKVSTILPYFADFDMIMTDATVVDEQLQPIAPSFYAMRKSGAGFWRNFAKCRYVGCCMAFTRPIAEAALPIPRGAYMHDAWIGLIAEANFRTIFAPHQLIEYRRHGGNVTDTSSMDKRVSVRIVWRRLAIGAGVFLRSARLAVRRQRDRSIRND